jgi:hypothetical protein
MESDLYLFEVISHWGTAVGTIALAVLLLRTIKQMEVTVRQSTLETEYRLRPWIAPNSNITKMENSMNEKLQFDISIKNYGRLPANKILAKFKKDTKMLSKSDINSQNLDSYDLGPLLPDMEKHYWFFIEKDLWEKAQRGEEKIFTLIYFEYQSPSGKSGYGMLSEFNPNSNNFIHKDMWIDN